MDSIGTGKDSVMSMALAYPPESREIFVSLRISIPDECIPIGNGLYSSKFQVRLQEWHIGYGTSDKDLRDPIKDHIS
jgi:hypothetical protein